MAKTLGTWWSAARNTGRSGDRGRRRRSAVLVRFEEVEPRVLLAASFSIADASLAEGNAGTSNMSFTVTRTGDTTQTVVVAYHTSDGTATAGTDYVTTSGNLTFSPGDTTKTISVPVVGNTTPQSDRTFTVTLDSLDYTNPAPTFGAAQFPVTTAKFSYAIDAGDFDGDGRVDFVASNTQGNSSFIFQIFPNTTTAGSSTFSFNNGGVVFADGTFSAAAADYDGDGKTDLATADFNVVIINQNMGVDQGGTNFSDNGSKTVGSTQLTGLTQGDLNGDGKPDIAVIDSTGLHILVNGSSGANNFAFTVSSGIALSGQDKVIAGDFNADGKMDLLAYTTSGSSVLFFRGQGDGTVAAPTSVSLGLSGNLIGTIESTHLDAKGQNTLPDANGDGKPDLLIQYEQGSPQGFGLYRNLTPKGATTLVFDTAQNFPKAGLYDNAGAVADFNGDGLADLLSGDVITTSPGVTKFELRQNTSASHPAPTIADGSATGTIQDDDQPSLSIGNVSLSEGNSGTTTFNFVVTLSAPSTQSITVNYATADGTAKAPSDYAATNGTLTFNVGETTKTIPIAVNGDTAFEPNETFTVVLSSPSHATISQGTGTGTIQNDDAQPTVSLAFNPASVSEAGGTSQLTATLSAVSGLDTTVNLSYSGSAVSGVNYTGAPASITILAGMMSGSATVTGKDDATYSNGSTLVASITTASNATPSGGSATLTFTEASAPPTVALSVAGSPFAENGGVATVTATRTGATTLPIVVSLTFSGTAANGVNYDASNNSITIAPGQTSGSITLTGKDDGIFGPNKTATVAIASATNATPSGGPASAVEAESGTAPTINLSISNPSFSEKGGTATVTATQSTKSASDTTILLVFSGPAANGTQYTTTASSITIPAGSTSGSVTILGVDDNKFGPDLPVTVTLGNITNAAAGANPSVQSTRLEADPQPTVALSVQGSPIPEAGGVGTVTATLSAPSNLPTTVNLTFGGTATQNVNYTPQSSTIFIAPGQTMGSVNLSAINDGKFGPNLTIVSTIASATNAVSTGGPATATITEADAQPVVSLAISNNSFPENGGSATVTASLSEVSAFNTVINLSFAGSAVLGVNYSASNTVLTIPAGQTSASFNLNGMDDGRYGGPRNVTVSISSASHATPSGNTVSAQITESSPLPTLSVSGTTASEAGPNAFFVVTLSAPSNLTTSVDYVALDNTAVAGADYKASTGTLTFNPGETAKLIAVPIVNDAINEATEDFFVQILNPVNAGIGTNQATGIIVDDDQPPTVSIDDFSKVEGNSGTSSATTLVHLSAPSALPVTVAYSTSNISAQAGIDYTATNGAVTFAPGETVKTISVPILANTLSQPDRTFAVNLSSPSNATIADGQAIGTINDDDPAVGLFIDDTSALQGASGTTTATFIVHLGTASGQAVSVQYATANGTAVAGVDYVAKSGIVTFPAGTTQQTIDVTILGQPTSSDPKTFVINLSNPVNSSISDGQATATITNTAPGPVASINSVSVGEGNSGTTNAVFTVSLSAPSQKTVTVNYTTGNGSAVAGADYQSVSGTVTFAPGSTLQTIIVPVIGNTTLQPDRTFQVVLGGAQNATIGQGVGTGTILDDDAVRQIVIGDVTVAEGSGGNANATFTVSLSQSSPVPVTVVYNTADGNAIAGSDYISTSGQLTFAPGETTKTINVPIVGDTLPEPTETFTVNLSSPTGATIARAQATGTILDDDVAPVATVGNASGNESSGNLTFVVRLSSPSALPVTVGYTTNDGTATAGADYSATQGTVTFAPGETAKVVLVPILNDTLSEPAETFTLTLMNPVNATVGGVLGTGTGTILDDDPLPSLTVDDFSKIEGNTGTSNATVIVRLSAASAQTVTVGYTTMDGSAVAGTDYASRTGSLTFAPGETVKMVAVPIIGNTLSQGDRTFSFDIAGPTNATISRAEATGTILDDDPVVGIFADDATVTQSSNTPTTLTFHVHLAAPSGLPVSVQYATANGTATAGSDYLSASGVINFAPGEIDKTVVVTILGDPVPEDTEQFSLVLSTPVNSTLSRGTATGTIISAVPGPSVSIGDTSVIEGNTGTTTATFTVTLSAASGRAVTVNYTTANGTATAGSDYAAQTGTLTFAPGQTVQTVSVVVNGDTQVEPDETFTVSLSGAQNATIVKATGTGTILDDDLVRVLTISDVTIPEGNSGQAPATFTVTLSSASPVPVVVSYTTAGQTATAGSDFLPVTGQLTFAPGETTKTVAVPVLGDTLAEGNETFLVTLAGAQNATITKADGVGTILDDDPVPLLSVSNVSVTESSANAIFVVKLSAPSAQTVTVGYMTSDGTAISPGDYAATTGTITFAPGETSKLVSVPIVNDTVNEATESFTLVLQNPTNAAIAAAMGTGTAMILDDDPLAQVSIDDFSKIEGNAGTTNASVTIRLLQASGVPVMVSYQTSALTATAGTDFIDSKGTVTFAPGEMVKTISIPIVGDTRSEGDETFAVNIVSASGATIARDQAIGTILDDDPVVGLFVDDASVTQSATTNTTATFTIRLGAASDLPVSVSYATANGTAIAGTDYLPASGVVMFAPGETTKTVNVTVLPNPSPQDTKQFSLVLSAAANSTISRGTATGTIINNVPAPTLSIGDASVIEGNTGTTTLVFSVSLSAASGRAVTVNYTTANGTGTAGSDYIAQTGTLTFAPGQTVQTVSVVVNGDTQVEPDETFTVNLSGAQNATIAKASGTGTILDDDLVRVITIDDVRQPEGNSGTSPMTFTLTLSAASAVPVVVSFATADLSAKAGSDYQPTSGLVTFAPGETTKTVAINIFGDTLPEGDETFTVSLSNPQNATIGRAQAIGTILDDDPAPLVSVAGGSVVESSPSALFTVTLSAPSGQTISVNYATSDGTALAGKDYTATSGTLTFAPGQTSLVISVPILNDTLFETDETFSLTLSGPVNSSIAAGFGTAKATIIDDDLPPSITIDDFSKVEGNAGSSNALVTIRLSGPSGQPVTVSYATADISATSGADYQATTGTVTFAPGETAKTITIPILGDTLFEGNETFAVNLSSPNGGTIARGQAIGTIQDDDAPVGVFIDDASVAEGNSGTSNVTLTIHLAAASGLPVSVSYSTANGTATAGSDYQATNGTVTFAPGETSKTITVPIVGDAVLEADEQFSVVLSNPVNTTISKGQATVTITNDDAGPNLSVDDIQVNEGDSGTTNAVFTVTLTGQSDLPVTVNFSTSDITATQGSDYVPTSGSLTFAPGESVKQVSVPVNGDTQVEANELFALNLSGAVNALITKSQGTATIIDNDVLPTISVADVSQAEGDSGTDPIVFSVTLSVPSPLTVTVNYSTANLTAIAGLDYQAVSGVLTFAPGQTVQTISVPVIGDTTFESDETFALNLAGAVNGTFANTLATGTISNDDQSPSASIDDVTVTEGDSGTVNAVFHVRLSAPSGLASSLIYVTADVTAVAGLDYEPTGGLLTFAPGQTQATVVVPIRADLLNEPTETFTINLLNPTNLTIARAQGVGTIRDNDPVPVITIGDVTVTEPDFGTALAGFPVMLSAPSAQVVTVHYATADGSANAFSDYLPMSGTITFAPGQTVQMIPVPVVGDTLNEATEVFLVTLDSPTNATLGNLQGVGTIRDNDAQPLLIASDATVTEGDAGTSNAIFYVQLTGPSSQAITVAYSTSDISATAGSDYVPVSGVLTFAPGETVKAVAVPVRSDIQIEGNEQFFFNIGGAVNAGILRAQGVGTIVDDDSLVVGNANDSGPGSLRQAIIKANLNPGADLITFAIPGAGPFTIQLQAALPAITDPVTIDGTSQPGYGDAPLIDVDGGGAGDTADGFRLLAGNSTIRGLAITRFGGSGVHIQGKGGNAIQGDYIGVGTDGRSNLGNRLYGVMIDGSPNNDIGGSSLARNVISGNGIGGVYILSGLSTGNRVISNFVGTDASGTFAIPNGQNGVFIDNAPNNTVAGNLVSGNLTNGIKLYGRGTTKASVVNNNVGVTVTGSPLPNFGYGILLNQVGKKPRNITAPNVARFNALGDVKNLPRGETAARARRK